MRPGPWETYVRRCIGDSSAKEVAARTGISESTVGNWLRGERFTRPDLWRVRDFARVFGCPVPQALIAAGFDESYFATGMPMKPDPSTLTADELLTELRRRIPDEPQPRSRSVKSPNWSSAITVRTLSRKTRVEPFTRKLLKRSCRCSSPVDITFLKAQRTRMSSRSDRK